MSVYIRYVLTDDRAVTLGELETALRQVDPAYAIDGDLIRLGQAGCGIIDITHRGDPICDEDLDLLTRLAATKKHCKEIQAVIQQANAMVCVQPEHGLEPSTSDALAPLWDWLLATRTGMLAWEGGHFFNRAGELK